MVAARPATGEVWRWLDEISDPEIPVLSIVDLGIVRDVQWHAPSELTITITPTYSGCPAVEVIASEIRRSMKEHGIERLRLETRLSPPWTTDWMSEEARERLRAYGVAPPPRPIQINQSTVIECPHCGSDRVQVVSRFGSTLCKALYKCLSCLEPFDVFKRH